MFSTLYNEVLPHIVNLTECRCPTSSPSPHSTSSSVCSSSSPDNACETETKREAMFGICTQKAFYLGHMVHQLLLFYMGYLPESDRDSYMYKRINTTGVLLANLTRQYVTKFTKDAQQIILKELDSSNWQFCGNIFSVFAGKLNHIFNSSTLDAGIVYSLNTGKWGMKNYLAKSGVAQVLNRHNTSSILSHLRRSTTPIDKTNKLILPRELHLSAWGHMCPCETPEGGSIGSVRNFAITAEITCNVPDAFIRELLTNGQVDGVIPFPSDPGRFRPQMFTNRVKIVVNGDIVGCTSSPQTVYDTLVHLRRTGIIHPHVSIYCHRMCFHVVTDSGRVTRPCLIVTDGKLVLSECKDLLEQIMFHSHPASCSNEQISRVSWSDLTHASDTHPCCVEYIDAAEAEQSMICSSIAAFYKLMSADERRRYTHCELAPLLYWA